MSNSQKKAIDVCLETMADCLTMMRAGLVAVRWIGPKIGEMVGNWADCNVEMSRIG